MGSGRFYWIGGLLMLFIVNATIERMGIFSADEDGQPRILKIVALYKSSPEQARDTVSMGFGQCMRRESMLPVPKYVTNLFAESFLMRVKIFADNGSVDVSDPRIAKLIEADELVLDRKSEELDRRLENENQQTQDNVNALASKMAEADKTLMDCVTNLAAGKIRS